MTVHKTVLWHGQLCSVLFGKQKGGGILILALAACLKLILTKFACSMKKVSRAYQHIPSQKNTGYVLATLFTKMFTVMLISHLDHVSLIQHRR